MWRWTGVSYSVAATWVPYYHFVAGDCGAGPGYPVWESRPCRAPTSVEQRFSHSCWGRTQPLRGVSDAQRVSITLAQQLLVTGRSLTAAPH